MGNIIIFLVNGANDQFMLLSDPLYYMDQMSPKTLLRILPNQGHGGVWGAWNDNGDMKKLHQRYRYQTISIVLQKLKKKSA